MAPPVPPALGLVAFSTETLNGARDCSPHDAGESDRLFPSQIAREAANTALNAS